MELPAIPTFASLVPARPSTAAALAVSIAYELMVVRHLMRRVYAGYGYPNFSTSSPVLNAIMRLQDACLVKYDCLTVLRRVLPQRRLSMSEVLQCEALTRLGFQDQVYVTDLFYGFPNPLLADYDPSQARMHPVPGRWTVEAQARIRPVLVRYGAVLDSVEAFVDMGPQEFVERAKGGVRTLRQALQVLMLETSSYSCDP